MAINDGARVASLIREDLDRLHEHITQLVGIVGGSIGSAISARIDEPLASVKKHLVPVLDLLAGIEGDVAQVVRRRPGRPRKNAVAEAPATRQRRRRGGRGRKANITPEILEAALREANGVKTKAAEILKVSQPTLYKYLDAFSAAASPSAPTKRAPPRKSRKNKK